MRLGLILMTHGRSWLLPVAYITATSSNRAYSVQVKNHAASQGWFKTLGRCLGVRTSEVEPAPLVCLPASTGGFLEQSVWGWFASGEIFKLQLPRRFGQEEEGSRGDRNTQIEWVGLVVWMGSVDCMICVVTICWGREIPARLAAELEGWKHVSTLPWLLWSSIKSHRHFLKNCPAVQEKAKKAEAYKQKQLQENERKRWNRFQPVVRKVWSEFASSIKFINFIAFTMTYICFTCRFQDPDFPGYQ